MQMNYSRRHRMQRTVGLFTLVVLGSVRTHHGGVLSQTVTPQENFVLERWMGRWFEAAVVSTCPFFMQRKRATPHTLTLQLHHTSSQHNFTSTASVLRGGACQQNVTVYDLTDTPGRFFHHVARFGADVDTFVLRTNYEEFAVIQQLGTERPSGIQTISLKLYSRTVQVSPVVMDGYGKVVRQQGIDEESIIINQSKGVCPTVETGPV